MRTGICKVAAYVLAACLCRKKNWVPPPLQFPATPALPGAAREAAGRPAGLSPSPDLRAGDPDLRAGDPDLRAGARAVHLPRLARL